MCIRDSLSGAIPSWSGHEEDPGPLVIASSAEGPDRLVAPLAIELEVAPAPGVQEDAEAPGCLVPVEVE
eukprot:3121911-Alexandrium_andersonii.AAC.1